MTSMNNKEEQLEEEQPFAKKSENGDSKTKPKPKLHDDILIMVVEKMFFQKPEGDGYKAIDLRKGNPYTFFMAHKPITETAFITQFAKLRRVHFRKYGERSIDFHKDEDESDVANPNGIFTGPWRVSNMLLEEIIKRKKLRVTEVVTKYYLKDREACDLGTNASSLEAFCALFLGKKLDIADSMKNEYDLVINKLEINEYPEDIGKNFEAILAINSKELIFDAYFFIFDCLSLPRYQITADKTVKITITCEGQSDEFVSSSMMSYANFFIETCPNLTTLNFYIIIMEYNATDADELNTNLRSFMNEFLKPLDKGHSELKICLTLLFIFQGLHVYEAIPQNHVLFTFVTEIPTDNKTDDPIMEPDIARIIKMADAKGREHECILKVFIDNFIDMSESDPNQD